MLLRYPLSNMRERNSSIIEILPYQEFTKKHVDHSINNLINNEPNKNLQKILRDALFPGRRLRPTLLNMLIPNTSIQRDKDESLTKLQLAVEMLHRASIIVDDLLDNDILRMGEKTYHNKYDSNTTILISHYLVAKGYTLLTSVELEEKDKSLAHELFNNAYSQTTIGELADISKLPKETSYVELYDKLVLKKTASLFELVFCFSTLINKKSNISKLRNIGNTIGSLYQIHNDIYDEVHASTTERGLKSFSTATVSLINCITADYGSNKAKELVIKALGKNISKEKLQNLRNVYLEENLNSYAECYKNKKKDLLDEQLLSLNNDHITTVVDSFYKWLEDKNCWNQKNYENAGY